MRSLFCRWSPFALLAMAPLAGCSDVASQDKDAVRPSIAEFALIETSDKISRLESRIAENMVVPVLPRRGEETDYDLALRCARSARFLIAMVDQVPSALADRDRQTLDQAVTQIHRRAERFGLEEGKTLSDVRRDLEGSAILLDGVAASPEEKLRIALSCIQDSQT